MVERVAHGGQQCNRAEGTWQGRSRTVVVAQGDDAEIAETAKKYGAEIPFMRPAELASDHAAERMAWRHAIEWLNTSGLPDMAKRAAPPMKVLVPAPFTLCQ